MDPKIENKASTIIIEGSWAGLGGVLEESWRGLGGILEGLGGFLESLGGVLEASGRVLGGVLEPSGSHTCKSGQKLGSRTPPGPPNWNPKSTQKSSKSGQERQKSAIKRHKRAGPTAARSLSRVAKSGPRCPGTPPRGLLNDFWTIFGGKMEPSWHPNRSQTGCKLQKVGKPGIF